MAGVPDFEQLCRICLVKEQVNIAIFEDRDSAAPASLKISTCLPVKVSQDDDLPKKICDGCSYKLDMFYEFWNTSSASEKQLLEWLSELESPSKPIIKSVRGHSDVVLKQEVIDLGDTNVDDDDLHADDLNVSNDAQDYILQQQQLPYQTTFEFEQDGFTEGQVATVPSATVTSEIAKPKRKRRAAAMRAIPRDIDSEDEDDAGLVGTKIAKTEEHSDDSAEDPSFADLPSTSADEQPGPSGVGKGGTDASSGRRCRKRWSKLTNLSCPQCQKVCTSKTQYVNHRRYHLTNTRTTQKGTFVCAVCDKRCETKRDLWDHEKVHGVKSFECNVCSRIISTKAKLIAHKKRHIKDFTHSCAECGKGYYSPMNLKVHIDVVHGGIRYNCDKCGKIFKDRNYFHWHLKNHDKPLDDIRKEKKHKKHSESDKHVCHECGKMLSSKFALTVHLNIHAGEKPYVCSTCGKGFASPSSYAVHSRKHTGARPYTCTVCNATFTIRNSLVVHMRTHTGERPYPCKICEKAFVSRSRLNKHSRVHGSFLDEEKLKPFLCTLCNKRFPYKHVLVDHERSHTGERPFLCTICSKAFISKAVLRKHVKLHVAKNNKVLNNI